MWRSGRRRRLGRRHGYPGALVCRLEDRQTALLCISRGHYDDQRRRDQKRYACQPTECSAHRTNKPSSHRFFIIKRADHIRPAEKSPFNHQTDVVAANKAALLLQSSDLFAAQAGERDLELV
jgi:hypothetical protein